MERIKEFAKYISTKNKSFNIYILDVIIFIAVNLLIINEMPDIVFVGVVALLMLRLTDDYMNKFLNLSINLVDDRDDTEKLLSLMHVHSFPVKSYQKLVAKKIIRLSSAGFLCGMICGLILNHTSSYIGAVLCLILPWIMYYLKFSYFKFKLCHKDKISANSYMNFIAGLFIGAIHSLYRISSNVVLFVYCGFLTIVGYGGIIGGIKAPGVNESVIAYQVYYYSVSYCLMVGMLIFVFVSIFLKRYKYCRILQTAICIIIVGLCIFNDYHNKNNTLIITENKIYGTIKGDSYEYDFADIESYKIYEERSEIQMKLFMKDGREYKVFAREYTFTDKYAEEFHGEYNFVAYLLKSFKELNITGSIEDESKLLADAKAEDKESLSGMQEIVDMFN